MLGREGKPNVGGRRTYVESLDFQNGRGGAAFYNLAGRVGPR